VDRKEDGFEIRDDRRSSFALRRKRAWTKSTVDRAGNTAPLLGVFRNKEHPVSSVF